MPQQENWIILDRDGVINQDSSHYIKSPDEWHPLPYSLAAIALLSQAGYHLAVATNQSGIGRGYYTESDLQNIHHKMLQRITLVGGQIQGIYYCPHLPRDGCSCRKPQPGLLIQIAQDFEINRSQTIFVGDKYSDIEAARRAGMQPILVKTGHGLETVTKHPELPNQIKIYENLYEFACHTLQILEGL